MKNITSSIYTFDKLIEGGYLYVDKTEYIWRLVEQPYGMYFLSRPRRFGKSLTVSTLEAVFHGRKDLFKGLAIYGKEYDWQEYPVIHLDFGDRKASTPEELENSMRLALADCATSLKISINSENSAQDMLREIINLSSQRSKVVILIDEYDKPILDNAYNPQIREILRVLKGFYSVIKATEPVQRFVLLTGVSKFAHVSVFSDLNNLSDITMNADYATMLGYTQQELETCFADRLDQIVQNTKMPRADLLEKIKLWYNGYRFHPKGNTVYNPVSVAQFFIQDGEFNNYWFATGTPTFLFEVAKRSEFDFKNALTNPVSGLEFQSFDLDRLRAMPLLLQTGYLTIKEAFVRPDGTYYYLGFPNYEVESAFEHFLLDYFTEGQADIFHAIGELRECLAEGDIERFVKALQCFLASIPHHIHIAKESYYHSIVFTILKMLDLPATAEESTNAGRIDTSVTSGETIYIFEFKLDQTAQAAIDQIRKKDYARRYMNSGKKIMLVGFNFNSTLRQIDDWLAENH